MKSKYFLLIVVLFSVSSFAQLKEADLVFKDGDTVPGYARLIKNNKIEFKLSLEEEADFYDGILTNEVIFYGDEGIEVFEFVKTGLKRKHVLMKLLVFGKANLYESKEDYTEYLVQEDNISSNKRNRYQDEVTRGLFLKRKKEPVGFKIGKSFKQTAEHYFRDCKAIKDLFQSRNYLKLTKEEIVKEYNFICSD